MPALRYAGSTPSMWLCRYGRPPGLMPGMAKQKPTMRRAVVGAEHVAAHLAHHHQEAQRQQFDVREAPDELLQAQHVAEFLEQVQLADPDQRLASCHRASISSMLDS